MGMFIISVVAFITVPLIIFLYSSLYNTSYIYIHIIIYKKLMERKVGGSTGAGHRGIDTHEINFDFFIPRHTQKNIKNSILNSTSLEIFKPR